MPELPSFEALGGESYPEGRLWRCSCCDFTCDDDGPDNCPTHGTPMTRMMGRFPAINMDGTREV